MHSGRAALPAFLLFMSCISYAPAAPASPEVLRNVEYGRAGDVRLLLDAALPRTPEPAPAVIIVHGGAWVTGDRLANVQPLFAPLADAKIAWFSISYRLAKNVMQFGLGIDDVVTALAFVRAHADEYGIDPARIALVGESAGGQLAAMAALRLPPDEQVRGVVALYTPTDLVALAKDSDYVPKSIRDSVRGTPWEGLLLAGLAQLSPANQVRNGMPPFLLIHGTHDALVPYSQSADFCARMHAANDSCELFPVDGGGHGIRWWEAYPRLAGPYKRKMVDWLKQQLAVRKVST